MVPINPLQPDYTAPPKRHAVGPDSLGWALIGTGAIGWAELKGRTYRVGGWGLVLSDEGSGAWLGRELLRRVLWAHDRRIERTPLLEAAFAQFEGDPHAIVRWATKASPRDFAALAPIVLEHARLGDRTGSELMGEAALHIDALAARLVALGAEWLALLGGLAPEMQRWLSPPTRSHLRAPLGDGIDGALRLARHAAEAIAA